MKVEGKFPADVVGFQIKRNESHDGKQAAIDLEFGISQENASSWGEDFADLAFATMRTMPDEGDEDAVVFLVDSITPGKRVIFETHQVQIEDQKLTVQPELRKIKTVKGAPRVVATVRLAVDVSKSALVSALVRRVGDTVNVTFNPSQASFEFTKKPEEEADAGNGNGAKPPRVRKGKLTVVEEAPAEA